MNQIETVESNLVSSESPSETFTIVISHKSWSFDSLQYFSWLSKLHGMEISSMVGISRHRTGKNKVISHLYK